jgi:enamine deaminase RidA (YjgF/YER057c/UK114 family)
VTAETRLTELGLVLPAPATPAGSYVEAVAHDGLLHLAGHGPIRPDGSLVIGKVGVDLDVAAGAAAARITGLGLLATIRHQLGSLDRVQRVVKLLGLVNAAPDFGRHPEVINGASDLMIEVFGAAGRHARSAVGVASLPFGIAVEIEMIVAVGAA